MKFTLKEMNGLLNGKCLPSDLLVGETLADYLIRKFDDAQQQLAESHRALRAETTAHENTQMQLEKLAAENAGLKDGYRYQILSTDGDWFNATKEKFDEVKAAGWRVNDKGHYHDCPAKTPITEAFLAEVRAQGVEMFAAWNDKHIKNGVEHKESLTAVSHAARGFAALIRKGVQS